MKRTLTVIVLGLAALALLVGAALKSRSIPLEAHVARYTLDADVARLGEEFGTLVSSLETAWQSNQVPGEAASALHERVVGSLEGLERSVAAIPGNSLQRDRVENNLERLRTTLAAVDELTLTVLDQQTAYADSIAYLRDASTDVVRQLRDIGEPQLAADAFALVAETISYAAEPDANVEYRARRMLTALERDQGGDAVLLSKTGPLTAAVATVVEMGDGIESRLVQLASSSLIDNAEALNQAAIAAYQSAVSGAEQARTMLAIYAVVMLLSVGAIGYRLRISYRDLNRANAELGVLNESLEQRVQERTEDLSNAMDELKESQVQLVQAEKMSSLGQLVAGISHEINTPLLYLANNTSLIQERIDALKDFVTLSATALSLNPNQFKDRSEYQARLIQGLRNLKLMLKAGEIEASAEEIRDLNQDCIDGLADLTELAQSLKDFSRLDRAPVDSFDVNAGIDKTLNIARNTVKHKAEIKRFYGDIPKIECSPSKINQVFLNLITNAAQAIGEYGEIMISTKRHDKDHVIISIRDNGCGIPGENLNKIRDPFFTTKEIGVGTGLGLSVVDEIVRGHGGELLVDSRVEEGSTFSVILPIKQPKPERDPTAADSGRALAEAV